MSLPLPAGWLITFFATGALNVAAQTAKLPEPTPPAPRSTPTLPPYRSVLEGYQPFAEEKVQPWKETNDTVGRIGGWRAYAREASDAQAKDEQAPQAPEAPQGMQTPPATPANPHAGHGKP